MTITKFVLAAWYLVLGFAAAGVGQRVPDAELWRQVEIIRTEHGVPHIRAQNLRAAGYALAWLQCEDYGTRTPMAVLEASGRWASVEGYDRAESDFTVLRQRSRSLKRYALLSKATRDVYEGFAAGVNRYVILNLGAFPKYMPTDFQGQDVAATEIASFPTRKAKLFVDKLNPQPTPTPTAPAASQSDEGASTSDDGSNAWAFAPSRTKSGRAILLRNPHLAWTAGYYEAQLTVPGVVDFYGDFRIGGAFAVVGGFNRYLGFSTTNNSPDLEEFYALDVDPRDADRYLLDGRSVPLGHELLTVQFRNGDGLSSETREFWSTDLGPVVYRGKGKVYIVKVAGDGDARAGEQFLKMMRSRNLVEWKQAMKMRARLASNFTYADRDGNIFYLWNASLPLLPHPVGADLDAHPAKKSSDVWTQYVPFEALPQVLNPTGGYLHNENNSPHYTNIEGGVKTANAYPNFEEPELSLRAQLALQLVRGAIEKMSLEDVVKLKHSYRALLPERVKGELLAEVKKTGPTGDVAAAVQLLERWDNTTSPESRGSTLFEEWWATYSGLRRPERRAYPDDKRFARLWSVDDPFNTPRGLADPARAVESFTQAVAETKRRYGSLDVSWGEVHRVRRGPVDMPVGGCGNDLGCFRILGFGRAEDGKLAANSGDGWILAMEFGKDVPRAYSVLAYGESRLPDSPWFSDQAEMFAKGEVKPVAFTDQDVNARVVRRYRPGQSK